MYMYRRFGFLYHGTLSSSTKRVTMASPVFPVLMIAMVLKLRKVSTSLQQGKRLNLGLISYKHQVRIPFPGLLPRTCQMLSAPKTEGDPQNRGHV